MAWTKTNTWTGLAHWILNSTSPPKQTENGTLLQGICHTNVYTRPTSLLSLLVFTLNMRPFLFCTSHVELVHWEALQLSDSSYSVVLDVHLSSIITAWRYKRTFMITLGKLIVCWYSRFSSCKFPSHENMRLRFKTFFCLSHKYSW